MQAISFRPSVPSAVPSRTKKPVLDARTLFFLGLLLAASGSVSPPMALALGLAFALAVEHPFRLESQKLARLLLQIAVVALGFGMNLHQVLQAGRSGFLFTALSIAVAMAAGLGLGKWLKVGGKASFLITAGTAICGGSAIAALAPIAEANEEEISVSMATVFVLNSVALFLFPAIGGMLHLDQNQFGLWSALAIHDTSSVVGAAAKYGAEALAVGTTVKLTRALWILPLSLGTALYVQRTRRGARASGTAGVAVPWFIVFFGLATAISTYVPRFSSAYGTLTHLGKCGLAATLFLIGTGLSRSTMRQTGIRPFMQGVSLWIIVASLSLAAIYFRWIAI